LTRNYVYVILVLEPFQGGEKGMEQAFIGIKSESGKEREILEELKKIEEVKAAWIVYGPMDVRVLIEMENLSQLNSIVLEKVRKIPNIFDTDTEQIIESYER